MPIAAMLPLLLGAGFALQPPGLFHAGEAIAHDGEHWLALGVEDGRARLVAASVRVAAVEDALVDAPGERTGRAVTSVDAANALMFLRGPGLRAGAVVAAAIDENPGALISVPERVMVFAGAAHRLATHCAADGARVRGEGATSTCTVTLHAHGRAQRLHAFTAAAPAAGGATPVEVPLTLHFAGDLDRDGRLDLILDTSDHYNVTRPTLFLSGAAAAGMLVAPVAHHRAVGC